MLSVEFFSTNFDHVYSIQMIYNVHIIKLFSCSDEYISIRITLRDIFCNVLLLMSTDEWFARSYSASCSRYKSFQVEQVLYSM